MIKIMKRTFSIYIMVSFAALALFGFTAMGHEGSAHEGCVAAASQSMDCPGGMGTLEFAAFHLRAFRSFSSADVSAGIFTVMLLAALFALARVWGSGLARASLLRPFAPVPSFIHRHQSFAPPLELILWRWLALHENSPSTP